MVIHSLQPRILHLNHPKILGPPALLLRTGDIPTVASNLLATGPNNPLTKLLIKRKLHPLVPLQHQIGQTPRVPSLLQADLLTPASYLLASQVMIFILTLIIMIVMNKRKIEIT